jgi:hypothetical protein
MAPIYITHSCPSHPGLSIISTPPEPLNVLDSLVDKICGIRIMAKAINMGDDPTGHGRFLNPDAAHQGPQHP